MAGKSYQLVPPGRKGWRTWYKFLAVYMRKVKEGGGVSSALAATVALIELSSQDQLHNFPDEE